MKIAVLQFAPRWGDKATNLRNLVDLMVRAAKAGAKVVCAPELATTGYSFQGVSDARGVAEVIHPTEPGAMTLKLMQSLAKQLRVYLSWGMVEVGIGTGNLHNSQVLVAPDGTWVSYAKICLWGDDLLWATEGRSNPPIMRTIIDGKEWKIGLLICRDVRDKKDDHWDSFYQKGDADLVLMASNWGEGGFPATAWMDFVKDNNTALCVANRYGEEGPKPNKFGGGGSCIITPKNDKDHPNGVHCDGLLWNQDCIIYADV